MLPDQACIISITPLPRPPARPSSPTAQLPIPPAQYTTIGIQTSTHRPIQQHHILNIASNPPSARFFPAQQAPAHSFHAHRPSCPVLPRNLGSGCSLDSVRACFTFRPPSSTGSGDSIPARPASPTVRFLPQTGPICSAPAAPATTPIVPRRTPSSTSTRTLAFMSSSSTACFSASTSANSSLARLALACSFSSRPRNSRFAAESSLFEERRVSASRSWWSWD